MYDFSRYLPMLDQFTAGLSSFGVMDAVKENRVIMEALFVAKHSTCFVPTTDQFLDGIDAAFSEDGSNRKDKEVDIHKFFCDFVQDTDALQEQGTVYLQYCRIYIKPQRLLCEQNANNKVSEYTTNTNQNVGSTVWHVLIQ
jgi:hypothetical protein